MQFSIHRIWLLIRKQFAENQQLYLLGLLAIAGIMAAIIAFNIATKDGMVKNTQQFILLIGAIACGCIFTTTILSQFNEKTKGIQALTLPASILEKYFVAVLYSFLFFPIVFFVIAYPIMVIGHSIDTMVGHTNELYTFKKTEDLMVMIITFINLQTVALFCSILFRRYVFIKAVILTIAVVFAINLINPLITRTTLNLGVGIAKKVDGNVKEVIYDDDQKVIHTEIVKRSLLAKIESANPYSDVDIDYYGQNKIYNGASYTGFRTTIHNPYSAVFYVLLALMIPLLWVISWFKLKEKEL
jgi:hypothetical protein